MGDSMLMIYAGIFTVAFLVALPIYLRAEDKIADGPRAFKKAALLKITVSGICALCALLGFFIWGMHVNLVLALVSVALICSVVGDYFLQYIVLDEKKFKIGILFFALTQVFLSVFLSLYHGIGWPEFVIAALVVGGTWIIVTKLKWELGETKYPLLVYVGLLVFMVSKSVLALFSGEGITLSLALMAAGAVLFVVSDALLGIKYFAGGKESRSKLYLIAYFCAIFLIAQSTIF
ncbi:MAG: lysoplasmalogenase [Coriobacteriia bacterium]|nr:lysoplasmalogenase [Coriobacteriia bacterium]MCL2750454.1 lysoplasmalogenase [Coriobacteriia bacterium]